MKKGFVAVVAILALAAAAVAAVPLAEDLLASRIKSEIERDGTTTVRQVEVGLLARRVTLSDIKSSHAAGLSVDSWEASGLGWPLAELLQGRTPLAGFTWGSPLQADRLELKRVRVGEGGTAGTVGVERLVVEGIDLARFDASDDSPYRAQSLVARAMSALSVRRFEQSGTVVSLPGGGDSFGAAMITVERYEGGRMATATAFALEVTAVGGRSPLFRVADINVRGLDVRRILAVLSSAAWRPGTPMGQVRVERANASGFSGEMLTRYGVSLGSVDVEWVRESDLVGRGRTRIDGFVLAPSLRSIEALKVRMALQAMGLRELKLGFDCAGVEDRKQGVVTVDRCTLSGPDLAEVNFTARFVGADESFWHAIDDGDMPALFDSKAALATAKLVLADGSLLDRGIKALATTTGQSTSVVRANLARDIRRFQPAGMLITQNLTQLLDAVARFVEKGGTLTIEARPDPPLALDRIDYLASPGADLVNAFGLTATLSK